MKKYEIVLRKGEWKRNGKIDFRKLTTLSLEEDYRESIKEITDIVKEDSDMKIIGNDPTYVRFVWNKTPYEVLCVPIKK